MAKITILAFNDFMKVNDDDLFQDLTLPDGIEKDTLIDNILLECAEFEVTYSNPNFMKKAIGIWSKKHYRTFEKWIKALSIDYNPLENYDRQESWNDNSIENNNTSGSITGTNTGAAELKKSAFDDTSYAPYENTTTNESNTSTSSGTNDTTKNDSHTGRVHGNIGVTTSQQMLESELDIARWNIIQQITDLFVQEFCVAIYV